MAGKLEEGVSTCNVEAMSSKRCDHETCDRPECYTTRRFWPRKGRRGKLLIEDLNLGPYLCRSAVFFSLSSLTLHSLLYILDNERKRKEADYIFIHHELLFFSAIKRAHTHTHTHTYIQYIYIYIYIYIYTIYIYISQFILLVWSFGWLGLYKM